MSKKLAYWDETPHNNFLNFLGNSFEDDDENDESYCLLEDKLENFDEYKNDAIPYDFTISKKEVEDVMNDQDRLYKLNDLDLNNSSLSIRTKKIKNTNINLDKISSPPFNPKLKKKNIKKRLSKSSSNNSKILQRKNFNICNGDSIEIPQMHHSNENSFENNFNNGDIFQLNKNNKPSFQPSMDNSFIYKQNKNNSNKSKKQKSQVNTHINTHESFNYLNYQEAANRYINFERYKDNSNRAIMEMESYELIKLLLKQYDFFLQILIQNVLLTSDQGLKYRCYSLLFSFYMARERIINNVKLPEHDIYFNFCRIFNENKGIKMRPQISFFQPPILEIVSILVKFIMKKTFSKDEVSQILKEFYPFLNPIYFPISSKGILNNKLLSIKENTITIDNDNIHRLEKEGNADKMITNKENLLNNSMKSLTDENVDKDSVESNEDNNLGANKASLNYVGTFLNKKRRKFDNVDDHLLMIGLLMHGKKNIDMVQQLWLDSKTPQEIRHRIKNLTCLKAPDNIIKKWKNLNDSILSKQEFVLFLKGIQWFGIKKKWNVISRYFLPERSSDYLEEFFELLIETKVFGNEEIKINTQLNNFSIDKSKKKKNSKLFMCFKNSEILEKYKKDFQEEIKITLNSLNKSEVKNVFYTPDVFYEEVNINENVQNKNNFITTRNRNNILNNIFNNNLLKISAHDRSKKFPFDFHIKNADDNTFEKIIID